MKYTLDAIFFLVLMNLIYEAYGCKCDLKTNKQKFCEPTYVTRGKVTSRKFLNRHQIEYTVDVNYNFKMKLEDKIKVRTKRKSSACGVDLQVGEEYLISGHVRKRSQYETIYETNSCLWNDKWQRIAVATQRALFKREFDNCHL